MTSNATSETGCAHGRLVIEERAVRRGKTKLTLAGIEPGHELVMLRAPHVDQLVLVAVRECAFEGRAVLAPFGGCFVLGLQTGLDAFLIKSAVVVDEVVVFP
eukprot:5080975-Pleurochrysis_carterae.AAC.3